MNENIEAFLVYIRTSILIITSHIVKKTSIALLLIEKVITSRSYLNFAKFFFNKLLKSLFEYTKADEHLIK